MKLTRQQRRQLDRKYAKLYNKASNLISKTLEIPKVFRENPENRNENIYSSNNSDVVCFPSYYFKPESKEITWQQKMRDTRDAIEITERIALPTIFFIVIYKPHPYDTDEMAEKVSRTILSESINLSILMYIFRDDDIDFSKITPESFDKVSDNVIGDFIEANYDEIYKNMEIINERTKAAMCMGNET